MLCFKIHGIQSSSRIIKKIVKEKIIVATVTQDLEIPLNTKKAMNQGELTIGLNNMLHIQQEILKFMKGQNQNYKAGCMTQSDYVGNKSSYYSIRTTNYDKGIWVIDT